MTWRRRLPVAGKGVQHAVAGQYNGQEAEWQDRPREPRAICEVARYPDDDDDRKAGCWEY